ncbi:MAG: glycosyltransferase [Planctomycetia bacterium]|nr:glycosyltransferase [Planctomycetia bacterium]
MESNAAQRDSKGAANCWNICAEHQPAHAGLYRGIRDFAQAMPGGILSFDGVPQPSLADPPWPVVRRVTCGQGWLSRRCHALSPAAVAAADAATVEADLLAVHSLFRAHCRWIRDWAMRCGRPYWVVPHGCLDPAGLARRSLLKRLWMTRDGGPLFADSDAVIFATRREMAKAAQWLPGITSTPSGQGRGARGVIIPWPVEVPSLVGAEVAYAALRTRLRIDAEEKILLWVGRFHEAKRPLQAIQAFAAAKPSHCHMVIVGVDETLTRADIQRAIPERLTSHVHVLGELRGAALAEVWLAADGYISLSEKENFGYSAADALAHGVPVILSCGHDLAHDLPGAGEGRSAYGWVLPDDRLSSAVQAINEWGETVARCGIMSTSLSSVRESTRAWVAEKLSFERFHESLRDLTASSLSRSQGRSHRRTRF